MAGLEDGSFVGDLVKQQSCRPKYTRVISWELSRDTTEDLEEKRRKRRSFERKMRKGKRMVEHRKEHKTHSDSESPSSSAVQSENSDVDEDVINDNDDDTTNTNELAKTKIGKKAKYRQIKEELEWVTKDLGAIDLDANSELVDSHKPVAEFEVSNKPVPSLVDLCLRVDWKATSSDSEIKISDIAPGLQTIVRTKQQMCRTNAQQLKCFHQNLMIGDHCLQADLDEKNEGTSKKCQTFERSLTSVFPYANSRSGFSQIETLANTFYDESGYREGDEVLDGKSKH